MSDQPEKRESLPGLPRRALYRDIEPATIGAPTWAGRPLQAVTNVTNPEPLVTPSVTPSVTPVTPIVTPVMPAVTPAPAETVRLIRPDAGRSTRSDKVHVSAADRQKAYRERKKLTEADIRRALEGKPLP